ncbi:AAA family ATPase [Streptomyces sp. NPDC090025]|uniref:AAA family ATPase n=1 Tax=Streptomyces sp. NPDC090025 TaxID=3365922 RepID=UPI003838BA35
MESAEVRTPGRLVGRETETARLRALARPPRHPDAERAVILHGRPGMGRTALLDACAAEARSVGALVLRAAGARSESALTGGALHLALWSAPDGPDGLPGLADTLTRAAVGTPDDVLRLSTDLLAALRRAAGERPVLLVLDDVHWFDTESRAVFAFLARRLTGTRISLVAATADGARPFLDAAPTALCPVGPLPGTAAAELLDARHAGLAPEPRRRLLEAAAGSPLALLELPRALSPAQLTGREPLPAVLPLSDPLLRRYGPQVEDLPVEVRELVLLMALEEQGRTRPVWAAYRHGWAAAGEALTTAERDGILRVAGERERVVFSDPLLRAAVVATATPDALRAAHRALASVLDHEPGTQVRHLMAAAVGLDPAVAGALATGAARAARHGLERVALAAHRRAADLTGDAAERAALLALGAHNAGRAGRFGLAAELLAEASAGAPRPDGAPEGAAFALARAQLLAERGGDGRAAFHLLLGAFDSYGDAPGGESGPPVAWRDALLSRLFSLALLSGDAEQWHATASRLGTGPGWARLVKELAAPVADGSGRPTARLEAAVKELAPDADCAEVLRLSHLALALDGLGPLRERLRRVAEAAERGGSVADCAEALGIFGLDLLLAGHQDAAEEATTRMLHLAEAHGLFLTARRARAQSALMAAARGDAEAARTLVAASMTHPVPGGYATGAEPSTGAYGVVGAERMGGAPGVTGGDEVYGGPSRPHELSGPHRHDGATDPTSVIGPTGFTALMAHQASAWAALSEGSYAEAYAHALRASGAAADSAVLSPLQPWVVLTLVESAVLTGRTQEAHMHVAAAEAAGLAHRSARHLALLAGARALLAPPQQAESLFETSVGFPERERNAFVCARLRLAFERRRRVAGGNRSAVPAQTRGTGVRAVIAHPQPDPGAARITPLLPVGPAAPAPVVTGPAGNPAALTRQELQIGRLAASGLSNKEIGRRLYLSPRTVSTHLYNLFPKLGISSRAALHQRLTELGYHKESRPA